MYFCAAKCWIAIYCLANHTIFKIAVTAKKLNRHYIGIEQNPQYCVWTELRLERADVDKTIQGYTNGVFWERNTSHLQKS